MTPEGRAGLSPLELGLVIADKCRTARLTGNALGANQFGAGNRGNHLTLKTVQGFGLRRMGHNTLLVASNHKPDKFANLVALACRKKHTVVRSQVSPLLRFSRSLWPEVPAWLRDMPTSVIISAKSMTRKQRG